MAKMNEVLQFDTAHLDQIDREIGMIAREQIERPAQDIKSASSRYGIMVLLDENPTVIEENYERTKAFLGILQDKLESAEYYRDRLDEMIAGYKCVMLAEQEKIRIIDEARKKDTN